MGEGIMEISIIIICGNDEKNISKAISSSLFASQTIVVFANSTDQSKLISLKANQNITAVFTNDAYGKNFAKWRNLGLAKAKSKWIFYLDSDEYITNELAKELENITSHDKTHSYYAVPRQNYFLGKKVNHGGTYPDYQKRLFYKDDLMVWEGKLHEYPKVKGELGYLTKPILHNTHQDLSSMTTKTNIWTDILSENLLKTRHPKVVWWRIFRMFTTKLISRLFVEKMFLDGTVGWISALFESYDTALIYAKLWERQQKT